VQIITYCTKPTVIQKWPQLLLIAIGKSDTGFGPTVGGAMLLHIPLIRLRHYPILLLAALVVKRGVAAEDAQPGPILGMS
jgi:hypothetical protein